MPEEVVVVPEEVVVVPAELALSPLEEPQAARPSVETRRSPVRGAESARTQPTLADAQGCCAAA